LKAVFLVFLGGGLGSIARFWLSNKLNFLNWLPLGTLLANTFACFLLGLTVGAFCKTEESRWFWVAGFCGGFSTFSTFALEIRNLWQQDAGYGFIYTSVSILSGLISVSLGLVLAKALNS
jgi:CrcB protein